MGRKMSGETVEVLVTLRGIEVWHNGAFIKRWKYWKYVLGIATDYMLEKCLLQYKWQSRHIELFSPPPHSYDEIRSCHQSYYL